MLNRVFRSFAALIALSSSWFLIKSGFFLLNQPYIDDSLTYSDTFLILSVTAPYVCIGIGLVILGAGLYMLPQIIAPKSNFYRYRPAYSRNEIEKMESELALAVEQYDRLIYPDTDVITGFKASHPRVSSELHIRELITSKATGLSSEIARLKTSLESAQISCVTFLIVFSICATVAYMACAMTSGCRTNRWPRCATWRATYL